MAILRFVVGAVRLILKGNKAYYAWCGFLLLLIGVASTPMSARRSMA